MQISSSSRCSTSRITACIWRSGLPHPELPQHTAALEPSVPEERPPFRTFRAALHDLFINLPDPRVGAQWRGVTRTTRQEMAAQGVN